MVKFEGKKNYQDETIPTAIELLKYSQQVLEDVRKATPVAFLGSIVDASSSEYVGRRYFDNVPKNTRSRRSEAMNDFSGLYVFFNRGVPEYVGISKTVIRRFKQHLISDKENQSSFVFLIARARFEIETGSPHNGDRKTFPFEKYCRTIQDEFLDHWSFVVIPIVGGYAMSFTEIYVAAELGCKWNSFQTH